jgi:hypothetical protein
MSSKFVQDSGKSVGYPLRLLGSSYPNYTLFLGFKVEQILRFVLTIS